MAPPLLSVCMIVKNEEPVLGRALASAAGLGAELVVVDTGSTDWTVAIAEEAGAAVHHFAWVGDFSAARNFALARATGTWSLVLDADEVLTPACRAAVERVLRATTADALRVPVTAVDDQGAVALSMPSVRFVRSGRGYAYEGRVHETINGSVTRGGGRIDDCDELPLVHHGYTAAETARKDRRARNRDLLEEAHRAAPEDPKYWHYLGVELRAGGDSAGAAALFDRVLTKAPRHGLVGWSASALASIDLAERDFGAAWQVARAGFGQVLAGVQCLVQVGELALREGDADTARWCADEIERAPADESTDRATGLERAAELRAGARVTKEPGQPRTRDHVLGAVARYPRNTTLGARLVETCEAIGGRGKGALDAIKRSRSAPGVVSAAMTVCQRAGAAQQCLDLGDKTGVHNEGWAFALARSGDPERARRELLAFGDAAAPLAVVFGLAFDDEEAIEHGLAAASPAHRAALARIRAGGRVASEAAWIATSWLDHAASVREDGVAARLADALPWTIGERQALRALVTHTYDPIAALGLALAHPTELASLEVIGLVAYAHGDLPAAATMLSMRAQAGDAPVRVYLRAADALARLGRRADAAAVIALGREARPLSLALGAPGASAPAKGRPLRAAPSAPR